jgi:hypothetical protein
MNQSTKTAQTLNAKVGYEKVLVNLLSKTVHQLWSCPDRTRRITKAAQLQRNYILRRKTVNVRGKNFNPPPSKPEAQSIASPAHRMGVTLNVAPIFSPPVGFLGPSPNRRPDEIMLAK